VTFAAMQDHRNESRRLRQILAHFVAADAPPATGGAGHADAVVDASKAFHPLKDMNSPGSSIYSSNPMFIFAMRFLHDLSQ